MTAKILRQHFMRKKLFADIGRFLRSCIQCLSTIQGKKIRRSYGPSVHGTAASDLSQLNYLEIAEENSSEKYVLMLWNDHSNYCRLFAFQTVMLNSLPVLLSTGAQLLVFFLV